MEKETRYTVVNKFGKEIYHSDGFGNFVKDSIIVHVGGVLVMMIIALIVCGIASLFK